MEYTTNLGLKKLSESDPFSIEYFNENFDKMDNQFQGGLKLCLLSKTDYEASAHDNKTLYVVVETDENGAIQTVELLLGEISMCGGQNQTEIVEETAE